MNNIPKHLLSEQRMEVERLPEDIRSHKMGFKSTCKTCGTTWLTWIGNTPFRALTPEQLVPVIQCQEVHAQAERIVRRALRAKGTPAPIYPLIEGALNDI